MMVSLAYPDPATCSGSPELSTLARVPKAKKSQRMRAEEGKERNPSYCLFSSCSAGLLGHRPDHIM